MGIKDVLLVVRSRWALIAAVFLVVLGVAAGLTVLSPNQYQAKTQMFVSVNGGESASDLVSGNSFAESQVQSYTDVLTSPLVLAPVSQKLDLGMSAAELKKRLSVAVPQQTVLLTVTVTDTNPNRAASIANAVTNEFISKVPSLGAAGAKQNPVKVTVLERAVPSTSPVAPRPVRNLLIGGLVGLLLGLALAALKELLDTTIHNDAALRRVTDAPVIGVIPMDSTAPKQPIITQRHQQFGARAEAFRGLRTNLQFVQADLAKRSIVVTSSRPGEGKTTTTANLAVTLALQGAKVALIEGDLRRPRLLEYMGLEGGAGLTNVLIGQATPREVMQSYSVDGLGVMGAGPLPPNPSELLGSVRMQELLAELESHFDYVIIDSPPLLPVTDAAVTSRVTGGALLVVGAGIAGRDDVTKSLESLESVEANLLGIIVNMEPTKGAKASGYYGEGYAPSPDSEMLPTPAKTGREEPETRASARSIGTLS